VAAKEGKWCAVVDGQPTESDGVLGNNILFSPDSKRVAYGEQRGTQWFVEADGKEQGPFDGLGANTIRFSPDSVHLAFAANTGGKWELVVDGKPMETCDGFGQGGPSFHADGTLECLAFRDGVIYRVQYNPSK
jgi:hypothetical protein